MSVTMWKKEAKHCLKTRKLRAFRISLCLAALSVFFGFASYYLPQTIALVSQDKLLPTAAQIMLLVLSTALIGALRQGRTAWMYCSACGREPSRVQFLFWLRRGRGFRAALLFLNIRIRKTAWTVLMCLPSVGILIGAGVVADRQNTAIRLIAWIGGSVSLLIGLFLARFVHEQYSLAPILFARSPKKGVRSAIRGSCALMQDECARVFLLDLSFLPWALACLCAIPLAYVIPYYQQSKTCMLRDILRAHTI